ncbi:radical SAM protein, partial [Candidatus Bathyarchaeota archaeon]|nr:radical SAM protein [Candidatus Bathyarchaeota archaeon]
MKKSSFPEKTRVSIGSAIVLGLMRGRLDAEPTTVYLLTYQPGKCHANCGFCPQAKTSRSRTDMLSRVSWPLFPTQQVLSSIKRVAETNATKRVCVQALNYPTVFKDVLNIAREIKSRVKVPISISCQPLNQKQMK